jgi:(p)ppGpp synthase/HD superfamily hydrolase
VTSERRPFLGERFDRALAYAHQLHRAQTRKGSAVPYVAHLLAVAALVLEGGGDEDEAIAALLHDGPEDQGGLPTLREIERRFGRRVADIVAGCSDTYQTPKPAWGPRKEAHVESLRRAAPSVLLVASADKIHNARSVIADLGLSGSAAWNRFSAPREKQLWYYRAAVDAIRAAGGSPLLPELERTVAELERVAAETPDGEPRRSVAGRRVAEAPAKE